MISKKYVWIGGVGVIIVIAVIGIFSLKKVNIGVTNIINNQSPQVSSIAGLKCDNATRRPIAVMLESDIEGRPLSGIGQADAVVEMPVTPNGMTRFMAVYQCQTPKEIGAVRSAREDFIPLAAGFQSVYAHWGGEHGALEHLNQGVMDNINAMLYDGTIFYRKSGVKQPHNGFTTIALLTEQAQKDKYDLTKDFVGYPHTDMPPTRTLSNIANTIDLGYPPDFSVSWTYDSKTNTYLRTRSGTPEIDKNTGKQVSASVVVVMHTTAGIINKDYNTVKTTGHGTADIYQNGTVTQGAWKKDVSHLDSKLFINDLQGHEIKFIPGQIWFEISAPLQ
jgi:hypothetical protein